MQKLRPGALVTVRRRRWRVAGVRAFADCVLVTLANTDRANAVAVRRVLAPFDTIDPLVHATAARRVGIRRWRGACRGLLAAAAPAGALRSVRHAHIDLLPHQLEPALAVVRGDGTRVILADEVGLGKTIQAGLIVSELRARQAADRVLILAPAGLREQWREELLTRLGIESAVVDMADLRLRQSTLPSGINPWQTVPIAIASIDYVKRPEVLPAVASCSWDVIVVDEAHGVAGDTDRHQAVDALASRATYVLLLTATPHSGDRRAFASLCNLGNLGGEPPLFFRRRRSEVRASAGRRVKHLGVRSSAAELRMHALLAQFIRAVRREHGDRICLAASVLHKRAFSSPRSLERSIDRRLAALEAGVTGSSEQLALPLGDPAGELSDADQIPDWSRELAMSDPSREARLLRQLAAAAKTASAADSKLAALARLLRRAREPVIVFTEYRDTLLHLRDSLQCAVSVLHGGLGRRERADALRSFTSGGTRVLLATDAAGEGINLHHACRVVVNLELPWNPMRLEQRAGRVDRIGQRRVVHALHFVGRDTTEPRILVRLRERIARAQQDAGAPDPVGADEERAIAQMITTGAYPDDEPAEELPMPKLARPDFKLEGAREATRIGAARLAATDADDRLRDMLDTSAAWIARARRPMTRACLGGRLLLIYGVSLEDDAGHAVESTMVPVLITPSHGLTPETARILVRNGGAGQAVSEASRSWLDEAERVHLAFAARRLARERAIASGGAEPSARRQPGLFDRRAEAVHQSAMQQDRDAGEHSARRLLLLERSTAVARTAPRLLLVLAP